MSASFTVSFTPGHGEPTEILHPTAPPAQGAAWSGPDSNNPQISGHAWRVFTNGPLLTLYPVCDDQAAPASNHPPEFEQLTISPVSWGFPPSLVTDNQGLVELMKKRHDAGKYGPMPWEVWLKSFGLLKLWCCRKRKNPALEREWLNKLGGPGHTLFLWAGKTLTNQENHKFKKVSRDAIATIRFRADFQTGNGCKTFFLHDCTRTINDPKRQGPKKWQSEGGKSRSYWYHHPKEAREFADRIRQIKAGYTGRKYGKNIRVVETARSWWKGKHRGTELQDYLDDMHDDTILNLVKKDGRSRPRKHHSAKAGTLIIDG